ncbi:uncharacterized protein LOC128552873, partial [Mercenaria mercenaria]|uniref:uncharacterized protein LOC128552873 n=1 Tax=Mercenaria mercenaria TaxID=6596 RepID=UPI00234F341D
MDLSRISGLWLYPPQAPLIPQSVPKLHDFFGHRVFIWMPIKLWSLRVACPHQDCRHPELSHAGVYQVVRQVLDVSNFYNLVSETLWCKKCKRKMVSWSHSILSQLDIGHRSHFPCLLTTMKACDTKVAILMRQRGLGNSASQIQKKVKEQHSTEWYQKTIQYLSACKSVASAASSGLIVPQRFQEPPPMAPIPQYRWLMQVYVQDVLQRLSEVKANITSVFGRILKVDSTKKVTKKLAGPSAGTAEWATNVGNEYGQVLISVLTAGEGRFGLHRMAKGLMKRFADAGQPSPEVLYVDRDCCGPSNIKLLFADWQDIHVRLDVWHFMRRFSCGCYTDSHPLYGLFMKKLGHCIFAWDNDDLQALKAAKRSELVSRHVQNPSEDLIMGSITKNELALHCRRQTRGVDETTLMIEALIDAFDGEKGRDTLGTPLINSRRMREEWEGQKKHVACLQDPDNVQLYIKTGSLKKGGHTLPTYRSCRGSTSLESFHLHLNRFIPGTLANDTVFQAYLVDGLSRWNQDRASVLTSANEPQTYSGLLRFTANKMTQEIFQKHISAYTPPRKYTGELIGIEYLYDQTGRPLQEYDDDILQMEDTGLDVPEDDDGFHELEAEDMTIADFSVFEPNVCDQSEPLGLSPGTKRGTQQKQLKHDAPVIQQPTSVTTVCDQSEPFEMSPGTSTEQRDTPVTGQKTSATIGAQFESPSPGTAKTPVLHYPTDDEYINTAQPSSESVGPDHIAGYDKVQALAAYLADLRHGNMCLTSAQVEEIVQLWSALDDYDKQPIIFRPVFAQHSKGRFRAKRQGAPGVESTERSMRGPDSVPATRPDCNRYVEAVIDRLCSTFPGFRRREG